MNDLYVMNLESRIKSVIRDVPDFPKPGIQFKDITPILQNADLCRDIVESMHASFSKQKVDAVVGVESRGFLFGMMLAQRFGVPFVPVRKKGKLPYKTVSYEYDLEYGSATVEVHEDAIPEGARVLIHDDLLATGGTAAAAAELVRRLKGEVSGFVFVVGLDFLNGKKILESHSSNILTLVSY